MTTPSPNAPPPEAEQMLNRLLAAEEAGDFPAFIALGNHKFQHLRKEVFDRVHQALVARRDAGGYRLSYLTTITNRRGNQYIWRMALADGDEVLVQLWLDGEGKASGFLLTGIVPG